MASPHYDSAGTRAGLTQRQTRITSEEGEPEYNNDHDQEAVLHAYSIKLNDGNERMLQWFDTFSFYTQLLSDFLLVWDIAAAIIAFKLLPPGTMGGWDGSQYVRGNPLAVLGAVGFAISEACLVMFSIMIHVIRSVARRFTVGTGGGLNVARESDTGRLRPPTTTMSIALSEQDQHEIQENMYRNHTWGAFIYKTWQRITRGRTQDLVHIPDSDFTWISGTDGQETRAATAPEQSPTSPSNGVIGGVAGGGGGGGGGTAVNSETPVTGATIGSGPARVVAVIPENVQVVVKRRPRVSKIHIDVGSPTWGMVTYTFNLIIWAYSGMITAFMISSIVTD
jgi:hypothetical protein